MNKYEQFARLIVLHQCNYSDFAVDTYEQYVEKQREYFKEHVAPTKCFDFDSWFNLWGLSEDEFHFVVEMILEMGGYF